VTRSGGPGLAQEQMPGPGVDQRRATLAGGAQIVERPSQARPDARRESCRERRHRLSRDGAPLFLPRGPAAVEDPGVGSVQAERPRHPSGEDAVVVVVGDHQIALADAELAGTSGEPFGRRHLHRHGIVGIDEVLLPVDERGAGDVPVRVLGTFGVWQRRARMPAAHVEHPQPGSAEVVLEPRGADERSVGDSKG
jgi:hypothetical protein